MSLLSNLIERRLAKIQIDHEALMNALNDIGAVDDKTRKLLLQCGDLMIQLSELIDLSAVAIETYAKNIPNTIKE